MKADEPWTATGGTGALVCAKDVGVPGPAVGVPRPAVGVPGPAVGVPGPAPPDVCASVTVAGAAGATVVLLTGG